MKDTNLLRSITSLLVACLALAGGTIMLAMFLNRVFGPIQQVAPKVTGVEPRQLGPLDVDPVDQNLRELWIELNREESKTLRFPEGIEEAMLGDSIPVDSRNI